MNIKKKFTIFFIFISIITVTIVNIYNNEKTKFYLFTSKTEELSLGNLITLTFISGFTFSSILTLISKNKIEKSLEDNFINDDEINNNNEEFSNQESELDRPPERDVRESQPTISVNYRFVEQDNDSNTTRNSKTNKNNLNNDYNDWLNNDNDW